MNLTRTCRTPRGKIKVLQNNSGGSVTLTSSSKRLFQSLSVKKPIIQLLVSSAQGHLGAYSDGGLLVATFAADLVLRSMDTNHNPKILAEIFETFLTLCLEYLNNPSCKFRYKALLSDIGFMKLFVKSILETKPLCEWNEMKLGYISKLILETFLQSLSDESQSLHACDTVYTMTQLGHEFLESKTMQGLLLSAPELSKFRVQDLKPKFVFQNQHSYIKVALVTVSLSGDLDELSNLKYEVSEDVQVEDIILEGLSNFCESVIQSDVGLVLCQKVIHPQLKLSLRKAGVIVIDRVGLQPVKYISKLTGCIPIQSSDSCISDRCYGYIDSVQHEIINKKSYLLLQKADSPVSTLMLCHQHEQPLCELKDVCETSLDCLKQLLYHPVVLAGGGCWQVGLGNYLRAKVEEEKEKFSEDLECPASMIKEAAFLFSQALTTGALGGFHGYSISKTSGHVFRTDDCFSSCELEKPHCSCGIYQVKENEDFVRLHDSHALYFKTEEFNKDCITLEDVLKNQDVVLDSFSASLNALQTSVLTACSILKIGQVVENL